MKRLIVGFRGIATADVIKCQPESCFDATSKVFRDGFSGGDFLLQQALSLPLVLYRQLFLDFQFSYES